MPDVKGLTIKFSADTSKLEQDIKKVESASKKTASELKAIDRGLKFNPKSTTLLKQKFDALTRSVRQSETRLAQLKAKQKSMDAKGVSKSSKEYRALEREIIKTENQLDRAKKKLKEFGSVRFQQLSASLKAVGAKMQTVGKSMSMYVTAPLVAVGTVGAKKFAEVDKTMQLTNATMKNSKTEADLLNNAMKSAAASSTFGMNDAATASLNFARAGLKAKEAAAALAPAMALAAGEGGELDTVSNGLVATINGFHGSFDEASRYADVFANACNNSALDVNSLSKAMSVAAPIFSSAGYAVEDASLYMGVMANNGIEANKAANSLKTGLARLVSPAKQGAEMMDELGISVTNSDGSMKDSVTVQKELHDAFSKLSESEQIAAASAIFGKNQMAPWLALINTAPEDVTELNNAIYETGTAEQMQTKMMQGFGGSLEQLKSSADVAAESLGEALAPMIQKVAQALTSATTWFNSLSPSMQRIIAVVGVLVAALGPLLVILGTVFTSISAIGAGIAAASAAFAAAGPVIAGAFAVITGPVGLAVAAVAGAIAIGILLYKNWDKVKAHVQKAVDGLKQRFQTNFGAIGQRVRTNMNTVRTVVNTVVGAIRRKFDQLKAIKDNAGKTFESVKEKITKPINTAWGIVKKVVDKINGLFPISVGKIFSNIKLPHFSVSGGKAPWGFGGKGSLPNVSVGWNKDAMQFGKILKGAQIFGQANDGTLLGGGEVAREVVVGRNSLTATISAAVARGMNVSAGTIARAVGTQTALAGGTNGAPIVINNYLYKNGAQLGREIVDIYDTWKPRLG